MSGAGLKFCMEMRRPLTVADNKPTGVIVTLLIPRKEQ